MARPPFPPGTSNVRVWAGTGNTDSLDHPIFLPHGFWPRVRISGQRFPGSWAPGTQEPPPQLRALGSTTLS